MKILANMTKNNKYGNKYDNDKYKHMDDAVSHSYTEQISKLDST